MHQPQRAGAPSGYWRKVDREKTAMSDKRIAVQAGDVEREEQESDERVETTPVPTEKPLSAFQKRYREDPEFRAKKQEASRNRYRALRDKKAAAAAAAAAATPPPPPPPVVTQIAEKRRAPVAQKVVAVEEEPSDEEEPEEPAPRVTKARPAHSRQESQSLRMSDMEDLFGALTVEKQKRKALKNEFREFLRIVADANLEEKPAAPSFEPASGRRKR